MDTRIDPASGVAALSTDAQSVFGPVLYSYPFSRAIAEGDLKDYRLAVIAISDSQARKLLADENAEYVDRIGAPSLPILAAQARVSDQFGTLRGISFHARIEHAAEFVRTLRRVRGTHAEGLTARHVEGHMDHRVRSGRVHRRPRHPVHGLGTDSPRDRNPVLGALPAAPTP